MKEMGPYEKRNRGAQNRNGTIHIGTVCQKEGFDRRLGTVCEGKKQNYFIILRKGARMSIRFFL
jgi:hypothetical protein